MRKGRLNLKSFFLSAGMLVMLAGCASLQKQICEPSAETAKPSASEESSVRRKTARTTALTGVPPAPESAVAEQAKPLPVDNADIELTNKMLKAVDAYVFRGDAEEFTRLCRDKRFDCFVNNKRFPAGRQKLRRHAPPFVSGSKTGLRGSERVTVRYRFYP